MKWKKFSNWNNASIITISMLLTLIGSGILLMITSYNATADLTTSQVTIGNVFPELNVTVNDNQAQFTLNAGSYKTLNCTATITDYNGEDDIALVNATFFESGGGTGSFAADDNNNHYTNESCYIDTSFGDLYQAQSVCTMEIAYYANNNTWNCNVTAYDYGNLSTGVNDTVVIPALLALDIPSSINYGIVDALNVSSEREINVTNFGNVPINLNLDGYGAVDGDGNAMNCSLGSVKNITLENEGYNLTSTPASLTSFVEFNRSYIPLTDNAALVNIGIKQRQNDTTNDAINSTYWRVFVPLGTAGTCSGFVNFAAVVG
jgi:hypothetical protein